MKVSARNWQPQMNSDLYKAARAREGTGQRGRNEAADLLQTDPLQADLLETDLLAEQTGGKDQEEEDLSDQSLERLLEQAKKNGTNGAGANKMKSSTPDDSVGQLASELARAETRIDVQLVSSKAMRALANLKMSSMSCDEKDKKKIQQMIRRMEKLMKRIQKKLEHLGKEEQLENQQKRAEKKKEEQKAKEIREELRGRRNKRRREERRYALKELAEDGKNAAQETVAAMSEAIAPSAPTPSGTGTSAALTGVDLSAYTGDVGSVEGLTGDIAV